MCVMVTQMMAINTTSSAIDGDTHEAKVHECPLIRSGSTSHNKRLRSPATNGCKLLRVGGLLFCKSKVILTMREGRFSPA